MPSASPDPAEEEREPFAEVDPSGRFGRYAELLGHGAVKKVYKAFDIREGRDVAWNKIKLSKFSDAPYIISKIHSEVALLKNLKNENIIVLYHFWKEKEHNILNFITEECASGNLRDYRKKHRRVSIKALKKWSRQILQGLDYLHTHDPCVIHRDLNCSNIFINGNVGKVKIGDLGLATVVGKSHAAHSLLGTPEYMAPELYEENYTEKVTSGIKPQAFNKVSDTELKDFIERCIGQPRARPSAADLLKDPFLSDVADHEDDLNC
ncbi:probable serine/threonine-protein kinase WNK11 isoform X2 [Capsicum annuum]|uniref:probable serine/threonine-protein kinase WNK11 isoform X2 n=1 Tax=Capsicum annuum TaxID=4072 RepID=UPI001FB12AF9|nr:probable serine/threonine-protein kinase WNK11 isoform X2 [Capsicum annuum]